MIRLILGLRLLEVVNTTLEKLWCARLFESSRDVGGLQELIPKKLGLARYVLPLRDWEELDLTNPQQIADFDLRFASARQMQLLRKGRVMAHWAEERNFV